MQRPKTVREALANVDKQALALRRFMIAYWPLMEPQDYQPNKWPERGKWNEAVMRHTQPSKFGWIDKNNFIWHFYRAKWRVYPIANSVEERVDIYINQHLRTWRLTAIKACQDANIRW